VGGGHAAQELRQGLHHSLAQGGPARKGKATAWRRGSKQLTKVQLGLPVRSRESALRADPLQDLSGPNGKREAEDCTVR